MWILLLRPNYSAGGAEIAGNWPPTSASASSSSPMSSRLSTGKKFVTFCEELIRRDLGIIWDIETASPAFYATRRCCRSIARPP